MKARLVLLSLFVCASLSAQVLEVPTLESKGINGQVKSIEWHSHQAVQDKGLIYVKKDTETYDDKGRLVSVLTENFQNNQSYKTVYTLDKKGLLQQTQIVNPSNNLALRTTSYEYKKGLLVKTTQTQGTNTVVKNYSYNNQKQLIEVEVIQNGTVSLNEYYELDSEDRRTKISRKLPADTEAKVTSTFTYELKDGQLISVENRTTDQGEFIITKTIVASNRRDISEVTKRVSDGMQGVNRQFFEDDAQGNWVKGEVIGDQYSRSRLVLRKFTYADGSNSGRDKMSFPDDYHAQFIRQYSQKQVAVNGMVYNSGVAYSLDYTDDRLAYVPDLNTWVVLKDYDKNNNMKTWSEAQVIGGGRDVVYWAASSLGIDVFNAGRKFTSGGTGKETFSSYAFGGSHAAYIRGEVNQSFLAKDAAGQAGKLIQAELTNDHFYWGKISDSTYVLTNRGRSVGLQKQIEDSEGNKLAMYKQGSVYYWYFLPDFRQKFEGTQVGDIHTAEQVYDTRKFFAENRFKADLSSFSYTKLANTRYRLFSADKEVVTNVASYALKTPDEQLFAYFPLTQQYLLMEKFYDLEKGKEWPNQKVKVVSDSTPYVYYMYDNNKSINFYTPDGRIGNRAFANHKLDQNERAYGAIVYDSTSNISYGMTYDLDKDSGFGPMQKLPANGRGAYIIKLKGGRWVIIEKGIKVQDYSFSKLSEDGTVVHFFKDNKNKTQALEFRGFSNAQEGDIKYGVLSIKSSLDKYLQEFGIDPELKKPDEEGNPRKKSGTYDKKDNTFFLRDANGSYVQHQLAWYGNYGFDKDMIAYDSVAKIIYRLTDYYAEGDVEEKEAEVVIKKNEVKALKTQRSSLYLFIGGELQNDLERAFITQDPNDEIWREVIYDKSEERSFAVSYRSDSSSHIITPEPITNGDDHTYLYRTSEKSFFGIEKGGIIQDKSVRYRNLGNDLVRLDENPDKSVKRGYIFRGYKNTPMLELIGAEKVSLSDLVELWTKAGEEMKNKAGNK